MGGLRLKGFRGLHSGFKLFGVWAKGRLSLIHEITVLDSEVAELQARKQKRFIASYYLWLVTVSKQETDKGNRNAT